MTTLPDDPRLWEVGSDAELPLILAVYLLVAVVIIFIAAKLFLRRGL